MAADIRVVSRGDLRESGSGYTALPRVPGTSSNALEKRLPGNAAPVSSPSVAARLVQAVGRAHQAPAFRRHSGRGNRDGSRTTTRVGNGPIAGGEVDLGACPPAHPGSGRACPFASKHSRIPPQIHAVEGPILCRSAPQGAPCLANQHRPHPPNAFRWPVWTVDVHRDHGRVRYSAPCGADRHKIGPSTAEVLRHWRECFEAYETGRVLSAEGTENTLRALRLLTMVCHENRPYLPAHDRAGTSAPRGLCRRPARGGPLPRWRRG
jgi:hypothetical protein